MSPVPTSREKLIAAAAELFFRVGVHRTGVEALAAHAGVTKPTLYNLFGSKEGLVSEALTAIRLNREAELEAFVEAAGPPRERLWAMVDRHTRSLEIAHEYGFRGCPLALAAQEDPESEEARAVARDFKAWVRDRMARDARDAGLVDPDELAWQLMLLLEGGTIGTYLFGGAETARHIRDAARRLISSREPE